MAGARSKKAVKKTVEPPKKAAAGKGKKRGHDEVDQKLDVVVADLMPSPMKRSLRKSMGSADGVSKEKFWFVDADVFDAMEEDGRT